MAVIVPCTELTLPFPVFGGIVSAGLNVAQPTLRLAKLATLNGTQTKRQDFRESDYPGYAPVPLTAGWFVSLSPPSFFVTYTVPVVFEPTATVPGSGQLVMALFLTDSFTDGLVWCELLDPQFVMTGPGHALMITPQIRVMDRFAVDPFC